MPVSCLFYFCTLKMEATCFSGTLVEWKQTKRRYIPEDRTPHNHCCENFKSYNITPIYSGIFSQTRTAEPEEQPLLANDSETT
jgi:hypothetical protein